MYLPDFIAPFKREGKLLHAEELDLFTSLLADVETRNQSDDPSVSNTFTKRWLENKSEYAFSESVLSSKPPLAPPRLQ
jgi:hypothetical protein